MLGSFADAEDLVQDTLQRAWAARDSYCGSAPLRRWLFTIATNACLNALAKKRPLALPQLEAGPAGEDYVLQELERSHWITPAPDARLFSDPQARAEGRETVALAFVALLQRLPPRQRAVLLMKDVLGWSAEEIAEALELSLSSVNSALHRAREGVASARTTSDEPLPETLREYVRAWEARDLHGLVALLRKDIVFAMPPHAVWFRGSDAVERFVQQPRFQAFWSSGLRVLLTRANGVVALAFYRPDEQGVHVRHSIGVTRFVAGQVAESTVFIGPGYFAGFDLPEMMERTVSRGSAVMEGKGGPP
jgi:RNA polymerase sigma-70 factor (ECF subfamily)